MVASAHGDTSIAGHLARRSDNFLLLRIVAAIAVIYGHSFALARPNGTSDIFLRHGWPMYSGDIAVAISTSGKSANIVAALKQARAMKLVTVGLGGKGGGAMAPLCDHLLVVPSDTTARIQEMHILLGQMLCGALEIELGLVG